MFNNMAADKTRATGNEHFHFKMPLIAHWYAPGDRRFATNVMPHHRQSAKPSKIFLRAGRRTDWFGDRFRLTPATSTPYLSAECIE
jgi:hypothetical protein